MNEALYPCALFLQRRSFVIIWISVVMYLFYDTFTTYNTGPQYRHLRNILGIGLCISRATATVINVSCALILFPVCKKLNQLLYHALAKIWPRLFFFWLERSKSCHMILGITLYGFAAVHSGAHIANLWHFSKHYDDEHLNVNFAVHKNQNFLELLSTLPVMTGIFMLLITTFMACSSLRSVRRTHYNFFRYTHQLFFVFIALLLVHPMSGVLKEEVIVDSHKKQTFRHNNTNATNNIPEFIPIKSTTWMWMSLPLLCCSVDLLWRYCSRNQATVDVIEARHLPGRAILLVLSCPNRKFRCRVGQYLLIQCPDVSALEWHPFSVTKIPSYSQPYIRLLIRVKGDWTESLEKLMDNKTLRPEKNLKLLVDGPYSSPLESMVTSEIALCVAAGVGITPFTSLLSALLENPRSRHPRRVHLIWIVRRKCEISWIAELATRVLYELREANRPDRLHLELYVTNTLDNDRNLVSTTHTVTIDEQGIIYNSVDFKYNNSEKTVLLTPKNYRVNKNMQLGSNITKDNCAVKYTEDYKNILKRYPLLACRVKCGRPCWKKLFDYWIHLYPREKLPLYCCGPKTLVKTLQNRCIVTNQKSKTSITLIHEGFS